LKKAKKQSEIDLYKDFTEAGLMLPSEQDYKNEFEKEVFMAINLFRHEPVRWIALIQQVYKEASELKMVKALSQKQLIKYI